VRVACVWSKWFPLSFFDDVGAKGSTNERKYSLQRPCEQHVERRWSNCEDVAYGRSHTPALSPRMAKDDRVSCLHVALHSSQTTERPLLDLNGYLEPLLKLSLMNSRDFQAILRRHHCDCQRAVKTPRDIILCQSDALGLMPWYALHQVQQSRLKSSR
jgi:hypothetical protein